MKSLITKNLLQFILVTLLLTLLFRFGLSTSITNKMNIVIFIIGVTYAVFMWFSGRYFGVKDREHLPIFDIGFRFHFATFLAHNSISILWFTFGFQSKYENIKLIYMSASIWLFFLIVHGVYFFYIKKDTIKNLNKNELFE